MIKKALIGLFAGCVTGLFGAGGGMIVVPALGYILKLDDKKSRATSILCVLPMVCGASFFYFHSEYVDFQTSILCAIRWNYRRIYWRKAFKKIIK